jgi:LmbE family N-acetylglucosaminyl deacetylase
MTAKREKPVRALFVGPHCDDCEWMAGGTAQLLVRAGVDVTFLYVWGKHGRPSRQKPYAAAARAAAKRLGVRVKLLPLSSKLGAMRQHEVAERIWREVERLGPKLMFIPPPRDYMIDHQVVSHTAHHVAVTMGSHSVHGGPLEVYAMESPARPYRCPELVVDVSDVHALVEAALREYCRIDQSFGDGLAKTKAGLAALRGEQADRVACGEGLVTVMRQPRGSLLESLLGAERLWRFPHAAEVDCLRFGLP